MWKTDSMPVMSMPRCNLVAMSWSGDSGESFWDAWAVAFDGEAMQIDSVVSNAETMVAVVLAMWVAEAGQWVIMAFSWPQRWLLPSSDLEAFCAGSGGPTHGWDQQPWYLVWHG